MLPFTLKIYAEIDGNIIIKYTAYQRDLAPAWGTCLPRPISWFGQIGTTLLKIL